MRYFSIVGFAFIAFSVFYCLNPPELFTADAELDVNVFTILFFTGLATGGYCLVRLEWLFVVHREIIKRWTESIRRRRSETHHQRSPTGPALEHRDAERPSNEFKPDDAPPPEEDKENRPDTVL